MTEYNKFQKPGKDGSDYKGKFKKLLDWVFRLMMNLGYLVRVEAEPLRTIEWFNKEIKTAEMHGIDIGYVSDGYHTFGELYEHRITLFLSMVVILDEIDLWGCKSWYSYKHHDGSGYDGWILVCVEDIDTKEQISYHVPEEYVKLLKKTSVVGYEMAPVEFDGHTSEDVLKRLKKWFL